MKKKTAKTATAKPIDPRLQRLFDVIHEAWTDGNNSGRYMSTVLAVFEYVLTCTCPEPSSVEKALAAMLSDPRAGDLAGSPDEVFTKLAEIADAEHRAYCTCCQRAHAGKAAA